MNRVSATGILMRTGRGQSGYAEMALVIKRQGQDDAYVKFVLETTLDPVIQIRSVVHVEGFIRGYHTRDEKGKWKVVQYFIASKVTPAVGELEKTFGIKDHFYPKHEFKAYITGKVTSILSVSAEWKSLMISADGNKEVPEICILGLRDNKRLNEFKEITKGDTIAAFLNVHTPQKIINGEVRNYEDIIVEDIAISNREIERSVAPEKRANRKDSVRRTVFVPKENCFEETEE